ncbi:ribonuclease P protein subunit p14 [Salvelinus alpinus]|uniref:Ribonuclease P protein subunit p14 n=1 Tax=Salvelinus namaycush TaxID=8040 RepID=A0A8U0Q8N1_SALNM|nr:ribonuclease P protein subunit p14 [Salvelinus alpinus]XP_038839861.1 ribonuclease P protein subunit p14 [Salvelinus namaycush]XP_055725932.1 ribonuclease P protein subunit p14 [Salvelinus fontinalis]
MRRADIKDEPATYERLVYKNTSVYHYMRISLVLENESATLSAAQLKQLIVSGLRDLYGEVGGAFPFDLLKFDESTLTGVLRVYNSGLVKLWSALTLLGSYQEELCFFRVTQVSPFLLTLSGNSRELELD